jgi:hypothetical protein
MRSKGLVSRDITPLAAECHKQTVSDALGVLADEGGVHADREDRRRASEKRER